MSDVKIKTTITKYAVYLPKLDGFYTGATFRNSPDITQARLFNREQDARSRETVIENYFSHFSTYNGPGPNAAVVSIDITYEVYE